MGPQGHMCSWHTRRLATDLQPLESLHLQAWCASCKMSMYISNTVQEEKIAYAKLFQLRPADRQEHGSPMSIWSTTHTHTCNIPVPTQWVQVIVQV